MMQYKKCESVHSGFLATILSIGVKMSFCPAAIRPEAAVCSNPWTFVEPLGAIPIVSMTESIAWVVHLPMLDARKFWKEHPLPARNTCLLNIMMLL